MIVTESTNGIDVINYSAGDGSFGGIGGFCSNLPSAVGKMP